jgi:NAD(P)-dependent dehydrogenase (short-subunit alcohol dehydrogenase family)
MRLKDKIAIVVGAGQSPGEGMGNGRATVLRFVQEGATVMAVDRDLGSAEETVAMARQHGGFALASAASGLREHSTSSCAGPSLRSAAQRCVAFEADVTKEKTLAEMVATAYQQFGRIDVLHYNVGLSIAGGDASPTEITEEAFDRVTAINLRGCVMAVKHVLPVMREQRSGVIITISSLAAWEVYPYVTYKATKAAMIAYTQQIAIQNAEYGIRANVILPGLMNTPMAVDTRARHSGKPRAEIAAARDAKVPLRGKMGTAWDVANAALFLASEEANFITGVALPVDGGALVKIG